MKNGHPAACTVCISAIILICFSCNKENKKPQPSIALDDYLGLRVGNTLEYIVVKYELTRKPGANSRFTSMDSTIRTKTITSLTDSTWYYSIKDSLYFHRHCSGPKSVYLDTPIVTVYGDTCTRHATGLDCRHCDYADLDLNMSTHQWEDSVTDGDAMHSYFWKMLGPPVDFVYYGKNIGLTLYCHETGDTLQGHGETMVLKKFNGIGNNLARLFSNYRIDESYTF